MIRACLGSLLVLTIASPALAQDTTRIGAVSLAYVARSSKAGKSALADIDKFVKEKEAEGAARAAALQRQQVELEKTGISLSTRARGDLGCAHEEPAGAAREKSSPGLRESETRRRERETRRAARIHGPGVRVLHHAA